MTTRSKKNRREDTPPNLTPFGRGVGAYLRRYAGALTLAVLGSLAAAGLEAAFPRLLGWLVDLLGGREPQLLELLAGWGVTDPSRTALWLLPAAMGAAMLLAGVFSFFSLYAAARAGQDLAARMRRAGLERLLSVPFVDFLRARSGELISRLDESPRGLAGAATTLRDLIKSLLTVILVTTLIVVHHWRMAIFIAGVFALIGPAVALFNRHARRYARRHSRATADILGYAGERLAAVELVTAFGAAKQEEESFEEPAHRHYRYRLKSEALTTAYRGLVQFLVGAGLVGLLIYGGSLVRRELLTTGGLFELIGLMAIAFEPIKTLSRARLRLAPAGIELARFNSLLAWTPGGTPEELALEESEERYLPDPALLWPSAEAADEDCGPAGGVEIDGELRFENVVYSIEGRRILDGVGFSVPATGVTALVGPSGAGKSTLLNLALGLLEPDEGRVLLDGRPLSTYEPRLLRRRQALVPQEIVLSAGTVAENLRLARPEATDEELWRALEAADAAGVVRRLPEGLDAEIGERGGLLSGGEGQRLAIARALLRDPRLLVLDEPTANLDAESERRVHSSLNAATSGRGVLVVAHRLATVRDAERIHFLENGRIIESGSHDELLARGGRYAELARLQSVDDPGSSR